MAFVGFLIFWAISFIAGQLLRAFTTKLPKAPKGDVETPRTEEGQQIPAVFGTVKLGPTTLWFGDVDAVPVKKRVRTSLFTSSRQTIGYKYLVGMQGGLCWGPVDALVDIVLAEKYKASDITSIDYRKEIAGLVLEFTASGISPSLPMAYAAGGTAITFDAPFVYGGPEKEGGVAGNVRFYFGSTTQAANSYLATNALATIPAYKGLCYVVWEHTDMGQSQYLKPWQFVVRRCPTTLGALVADTTLSRIGDDANPAEVLYELLTDARWGLGRPTTDYDTASFTDALQTLSTEGLGISGTHLGASNADEKVKEILAHIDGVLVPDPITGKIQLTLIRADYTVADLETFTPSNSRDLEYSRPDAPELTTEIKVRYTDASQDYTTRVRPAYNPAVRQATGRAHGVTVDYPMITTGANADRLALRDLKGLSSTLATGSIVLTRGGSHLAPGDPFVIDYPDEGLDSVVVRATRLNYGSPHSTEDIEVQFTEDVFGTASGVFVTDPSNPWTPPTPPAFGSVEVIPEFTLDATEGCVTLRITGLVSAIGTIQMRRQKGGEAVEDWITYLVDDPPLLCVDRDDIDTGVIAWKVTVNEPDGTTDTIEGEQEVPPLGADDGNAQGTPANLMPITMRTTPPLVLVGSEIGTATFIEPPEAKADRYYASLTKVGKMRPQIGSGRAAPDVVFTVIYSLNGGSTFAELGPTIDLDIAGYPLVGAYTAIAAEAQVNNVLLSWGLKGGTSTSVVEIGNIYLDAVSSTSPPASPEPPTTDVPTDGPGPLLLDLNAFTEEPDGPPEDPYISSWTDDSGNENHAFNDPDFQIEPNWVDNAFGTGKAGVDITDSLQGMSFPIPTGNDCTYYMVLDVNASESGGPSSNDATANPSILNSASFGQPASFQITLGPTRHIVANVWSSSFGNTNVQSTNALGTGAHILRFAWDRELAVMRVYIDGVEEIERTSLPTSFLATVNSSTETGRQQVVMGRSVFQAGPRMKVGRVLCYGAAHFGEGDTAVEDVLKTQFGLTY